MSSAKDEASPAVRVGVVGGTGYTGQELLRVLAGHPSVEVAFATSRSQAGRPSTYPGLDLSPPSDDAAAAVDILFLCLPHGDAAEWVERLRGGPRIVDLTADHRPGSGREAGAHYGLAEWPEPGIAEAALVANPGCYPTGALLSLLPLAEAGLIDTSRLVTVNAASGVTGAGRTPKPHLLFAEVAGNYRAYGVGNRHRHLREIRAGLPELSLLFQPHLLPVPRGILETITVPVGKGVAAAAVRDCWRRRYEGARAIQVMEEDGVPDEAVPSLASVVGTDRLALGAVDVDGVVEPVVTVVAALDNLGKGAAGQAVQNMNLMCGWDRELGLRC